jgi:dsDNA-binding SOS-regulon protein
MSRKHFSWLLALTLIAGAVILLIPVKTGHESGFEVTPLVPGMDSWVNDVTRVRIVEAGDKTVATVVRGEQGWSVEEAESYAADWARLKTLLAAVAQARIVELKTANPAYFDRLGLKDVADTASTAKKIEIGEGEHATSLLIGNTAQGRDGQYVRFPDKDQALLIDKTLEVAAELRDWLQRDIVDVADSEVVEVTIIHPDGEQLSVSKTSADDQDFTLQGLPEGRETQSSWSVNELGGSLSGLVLDQVTADSNIDWSQATHLHLLTADGVEFNADLAESDQKSWIRLVASLHTPQTDTTAVGDNGQPSEAEEASVAEAPVTEEAPTGEAPEEEVGTAAAESAEKDSAERVASINRRIQGWAYAIPQYKFQAMNKHLEDLLKPLEDKQEN